MITARESVAEKAEPSTLDVLDLGTNTNVTRPFLADLWGALEPLANALKQASGVAEVDENDFIEPI